MANLSGQLRLEQLEDSVALKVGRKYLGRIYGVKTIRLENGHATLFAGRSVDMIASLHGVVGVRPPGLPKGGSPEGKE